MNQLNELKLNLMDYATEITRKFNKELTIAVGRGKLDDIATVSLAITLLRKELKTMDSMLQEYYDEYTWELEKSVYGDEVSGNKE